MLALPRMTGSVRALGRPWLLHLHRAPGMTPLRVTVLAGVVLTPISVLAGMPVVTPLTLAYALGISGYLILRQQAELRALAPILEAPPDMHERFRDRLVRHPRPLLWSAWLVGPLLMGVVNFTASSVQSLLAGEWPDAAGLWGLALPALFWTVFVQMLLVFFRNAWVFHRLGQRHVEIDLLDVAALAPLGRVGVRNLLIFVGGYALAPLALIDAPGAGRSILTGFLVTAPFSLALLILPVYAVHRRLVQEKRAELDRIRRALHGDRSALAGSPIGHDSEKLPVTSLVLYRETIRQVKEWPVNAPALLRLVAYVVIPVLAWIAAAVVEHWVDAVL